MTSVVRSLSLATAVAAAGAGCGLLPPPPLAQDCAGWSQLDADGQLQTAQALIQPWLIDEARARQHLSPETPEAQVYSAVAGSLTKTCELQRRPGLRLADVVRDLYER
jgi:predicted Rossmann fold nucleotide-binding protein DprA/Smf involved in DNA uptake